ncbi:ATPCL [Bugula neritina]|uniref:ATPCL n=1 Tax=Bugula neritina TaxID=10212 RepID=A0A7J7IWS7_BUGNE|nr:ATPCL [Bugula neritina]
MSNHISAVVDRKEYWLPQVIHHRAACATRTESYVCVYSHRFADTILFHHEGGVDVGDVEAKALKMEVKVGAAVPTAAEISQTLLVNLTDDSVKSLVGKFIEALYKVYRNLHFTYMEINPLVIREGKIYILDLAAKLDQCAEYLCKAEWGEVEYPAPFGRKHILRRPTSRNWTASRERLSNSPY